MIHPEIRIRKGLKEYVHDEDDPTEFAWTETSKIGWRKVKFGGESEDKIRYAEFKEGEYVYTVIVFTEAIDRQAMENIINAMDSNR